MPIFSLDSTEDENSNKLLSELSKWILLHQESQTSLMHCISMKQIVSNLSTLHMTG